MKYDFSGVTGDLMLLLTTGIGAQNDTLGAPKVMIVDRIKVLVVVAGYPWLPVACVPIKPGVQGTVWFPQLSMASTKACNGSHQPHPSQPQNY